MAINELIARCEPTQVRHMMQVIEPQFQRDFISLLPKELALSVLSFLEPRDLLRAAQTCKSWRFLAEDNLLWKEKCREAGIEDVPRRRGLSRSVVPQTSHWKVNYNKRFISSFLNDCKRFIDQFTGCLHETTRHRNELEVQINSSAKNVKRTR